MTCPECDGYGTIPHECGEDTCCCPPEDAEAEECGTCGGSGEMRSSGEPLDPDDRE